MKIAFLSKRAVMLILPEAYVITDLLQAVIRAVCAIIDAFHFPTVAEATLTSAEGGVDISADAAEIQTALIKRVLPALQTHLV